MSERHMLGSPMNIGTLTVRNRIIMEAMGNGISELDGKVSPEDIAFYAERAKGGVGLIMSEAVSVDSKTGRANPRNMCIDDDSQIPGLKKLTDAVHEHGAAYFVELYHPGRQGACEMNGGNPMFAPSDIPCKLVQQPVKAMTVDDIRYMIEMFAEGARRSKEGGADGVLIHGSHGYLVNEFLSPYTNTRDDEYGGSVAGRAKFALDIIDAIKETCGKDYPVGIRISACEYLDYIGLDREDGITVELSKQYVKLFEEHGIDLIDVSSGIYETMNTAWEPVGFEQGWKVELAREIKSVANVPVVCTSIIREPEFAEKLLEEGVCDFIGSARSHLADPEWASKALSGRDDDIRKCVSCLNCMRTLMGGPVRCAVNAQACCELERCDLRKDGAGRSVAVIGAGPAGLEASRVLAERGFKVTLFERKDDLGGEFLLASLPPHKEKLRCFIDWEVRELAKLGVDIRAGKTPTHEDIASVEPEAVFAACGTEPVIPRSIPGITGDKVYTIFDVLEGRADLSGKKVVLIGGGMSGIETAEYLDANGSEVTVFEMLDEIAKGELFQNVMDIEMRLGKVPQHTNHKLVSIEESECVIEDITSGEVKKIPYDAVVLSLGMKPSKFAEEALADFNTIVIGSTVKFGPVAIAVENAYLAAYNY